MIRTNLLPSPLSTCKSDADVSPLAPICWRRVDYNANINWIMVGQPDGRRLNVINSFYVKFERHGWTVVAVYIGPPMRPDEKYLLISQAFAGKQRLMPFINRQNFQRPNCDRFLVSLLIPLYGRILNDNFVKKTKNRLTIR